MLTKLEFQKLCQQLKLPLKSQKVLTHIRADKSEREPLRCLDSDPPRPYWLGVFDSAKMRRRFSFVRNQQQLLLLRYLEKSPLTLEYYVYPLPIQDSFAGRMQYSPQFLVIENNDISYIDWLLEAWPSESLDDPSLGLQYHLQRIAEQFDEQARYRALQLETFLGKDYAQVPKRIARDIVTFVTAHPGASLGEIGDAVSGAVADHVLTLCALGQLEAGGLSDNFNDLWFITFHPVASQRQSSRQTLVPQSEDDMAF